MPQPGPRWLAVADLDGGGQRVLFVASDAHPDSARVRLAAAAADALDGVIVEARLDDSVTTVHVLPAVAPKAPPVWFVELRENSARPPAVTLLAFAAAAGTPPAGRVVAEADAPAGVTSDDQVGAVRWYPATGEVDQVYVQPAWRRRSVGTVLVLAASTLSMARGWPRLWGDGQRTQLGEAWRNASVWRDRTAALTHVAPPMTPGE